MIGTLIPGIGAIGRELIAAETAMTTLRQLGPRGRHYISDNAYNFSKKWNDNLAADIRALRRAHLLSKQFKQVKIDKTVTRLVNGTRHQIKIPLVFQAELPIKVIHQFHVTIDRETYQVSCKAPMPTNEAISALKEHGSKFDHTEVWWVPNDVLVERIPDPDPIVVGCIKLHRADHVYFELHRWTDESVETAYWAKEGY